MFTISLLLVATGLVFFGVSHYLFESPSESIAPYSLMFFYIGILFMAAGFCCVFFEKGVDLNEVHTHLCYSWLGCFCSW